MRTVTRLFLPVIVLAAGLLAAPAAVAQCLGPDGLDAAPCCNPVVPNLPPFPDGVPPALGICWDDCALVATQDLRVLWSSPSPVACGEYVSQLTVFDAVSGSVLLSGLMNLSYTRTWDEIDPTGIPRQVWRFVVKADLQGSTASFSPCVQPSCIAPAGPHPTAFYYGYLDYAGCLPGMPMDNALVLYHACDRFVHTPGFSDRPGVFHPTVDHAIVAPHTAASPFVPANNVALGGPLIAEATRTVLPTSTACLAEDKVVAGDMQKLGAGCLCLLTTLPKRDTVRKFGGATLCGGAWTSLDLLWPTLPWLHLVSTSIGCWTDPSVYPGEECAWADEGLFIHQDACSGDWVELKYGGTTAKGWPAILHTGVTTQNFTDLADNYTSPLSGPHTLPIYGSVFPTDHLIYVNVP